MKRPNPGGKVIVTVSNPFVDMLIKPHSIPAVSIYTGTVLPNDEWMSDLEFNLSSDEINHPVRGIALQWVTDIKPIDNCPISFTDVDIVKSQSWEIASSRGDKTYSVRVEDGRWMCNCVAGAYRKKTQCRHIADAQKRLREVV